jgi:hypothetical protein
VIVNSVGGHISTATERLRKELDASEEINVFPAVPSVEAWLFADEGVIKNQKIDERILKHVPDALPDELSNARELAHQVFGPPDLWEGLSQPDLYQAAGRSVSLRHFLDAIARRSGVGADLPAQAVSRNISRSAIASLMRDLLAEDAIAWRTLGGETYTADKLAREIEQGTPVGREYAVDLVSMMINMLARSARRKSES